MRVNEIIVRLRNKGRNLVEQSEILMSYTYGTVIQVQNMHLGEWTDVAPYDLNRNACEDKEWPSYSEGHVFRIKPESENT